MCLATEITSTLQKSVSDHRFYQYIVVAVGNSPFKIMCSNLSNLCIYNSDTVQ